MKTEAREARVTRVRPSGAMWMEGGGYYTETAAELQVRPKLPDLRRLRHRRLARLFDLCGNAGPRAQVLEVGCGRSQWLPYLARFCGCTVAGIDIEPFAAELAQANLIGAGVRGRVLCRDAFAIEANTDLLGQFDLIYSMGVIEHFDEAAPRLAVLARYMAMGGRILTTVPNLRGVNGFLQRFVDVNRFEMHVIYDAAGLARVHEASGFETLAVGYVGFYDGYLTSPGLSAAPVRRKIHHWVCRASNLAAEAWTRAMKELGSPELSWLAPHIFYVGQLRAARRSGR